MIDNPYRPGAGHSPPYLAGRETEQRMFRQSLRDFLSENLIVTGLRGVGKTVLVERLREIATEERWLWIGNDLSESSGLTEERIAVRIMTDVAEALDRITVAEPATGGARGMGFVPARGRDVRPATFDALRSQYDSVPGLASDKLKAVMRQVGQRVSEAGYAGIVFAYDEAQCLTDHADRNEFPMSVLVETFQALQKRDAPAKMVLVLCGLPALFDALTAARTYTERMFRVMSLERLSRKDTLEAVLRPLAGLAAPMRPNQALIEKTADLTGGYPYLIQFFGKELVDALVASGGKLEVDNFPSPEVMERLDHGLFAARWNRTTDKQREFLKVIAEMDPDESSVEFSANDIATASADLAANAFTNAYATQMLHGLCERGVVYRTRHGRYAFALPMSTRMILRRLQSSEAVARSWRNATPNTQIQALMARFADADSTAETVATAPPPQPPAAPRLKSWDFAAMRPD